MRIYPALLNLTLDNCGLRHDETVYKKFAKLALPDLSLQAAPALRIWHHLWRRRWKLTFMPFGKRLCASTDDSRGTGMAA